MKEYKVKVPDDKDKFFKDLLSNLGVEYSEVSEGKGTKDFFTKSSRRSARKESPPAYRVDDEKREKAAKIREKSLIDVIKKIEEMRSR